MTNGNILTETRGKLLIVTVNRPGKLNALNKATLGELHETISGAASDDSVRGLILTGAGGKAFVAGADIGEFAAFTAEEGAAMSREGQEKVFDLIEGLSKPVIAAINGYALGGGLELALACHMRVACRHARLGLPEVSLGLIPGYGGTQRLTQVVGKAKALEMILTGRPVDAAEAQALGLVNHTVSDTDELVPFCTELFEDILDKPPLAVAAAIRAVNAAGEPGKAGFGTETQAFGELFATDDFKEGTRAFLEKRKPVFKGK